MKICHLTSVHPRNDIRIFVKECDSLRKLYQVSLVVADGLGNDDVKGVRVFDVGKPSGRRERMTKFGEKVFRKAIEIDADVYHFHDPELIPVGIKLKKSGKKVIYDVHEDLPRQLLTKPYLNKFVLKILSFIVEKYENYAVKKFDHIITATPRIRDRFKRFKKEVTDVNNFPIIEELNEDVNWSVRKNEICYIGGISRQRGIIEVVKALELTDTMLHLAGDFETEELRKEVESLQGWEKVRFYGFVDRNKIKEILSIVKAGLVVLHPFESYKYSLPIKLFEYMGRGVPVIASDFPLWREIVEETGTGVLVNPLSSESIAEGINKVLANDEVAKKMGKNGIIAVSEKYNWEVEEKKLFSIYKDLG